MKGLARQTTGGLGEWSEYSVYTIINVASEYSDSSVTSERRISSEYSVLVIPVNTVFPVNTVIHAIVFFSFSVNVVIPVNTVFPVNTVIHARKNTIIYCACAMDPH